MRQAIGVRGAFQRQVGTSSRPVAGLQRALGVEHDDVDEVGSRRYGDGSHRLLVDADGVTGVCTGM